VQRKGTIKGKGKERGARLKMRSAGVESGLGSYCVMETAAGGETEDGGGQDISSKF